MRRGSSGLFPDQFPRSMSRARAPQLLEPCVAAAAFAVAVIAPGILFIEVLVIFLGGIELTRLGDLGGDRLVEALGRLDGLLGVLGRLLLRVVEIEDGRAILRAAIAE